MKFNKLKIFLESKEQTIALVPGSFKPPTAAHWNMITKYSEIVGPEGKVIIFISSPKKEKRLSTNGKEITPKISKEIFNIYKEDTPNSENIEIKISEFPSPITTTCEYAKEYLNNSKYNIIFGASTKKDDKGNPDWYRWKFLPNWIKKENLKFNLIDPEKTAVDSFKNISASEVRNLKSPKKLVNYIPNNISNENKEKIKDLLF